MSARVASHVALGIAAAVAMAGCGGKKGAAADSSAPDTTVAASPAPTTTVPDTTLPVMLPPKADTVMRSGAPITRPSAVSQPTRPTPAPKYSTDTVRGGGLRPVPAPNDVRPSIRNNTPVLGLPGDTAKHRLPPR